MATRRCDAVPNIAAPKGPPVSCSTFSLDSSIAKYKRKGETFVTVTGNVIYSFCDVCAGGQSADPELDFAIPVRVTIGCGGICVNSTLNKAEKTTMIAKFETRKAQVLASADTDERVKVHVKWLEGAFREMLRK